MAGMHLVDFEKKKVIELILLNISDCNSNDCLPFSLLIQQAQYIKRR